MSSKILVTTSSFSIKNEGLILNPHKRKLTEEELIALVSEHHPDAIIAGVEPITKRVFNTAPEIKIIARVGVGMDNVDQQAASELNIKVTNTPDAVTAPVAELTIGLILTTLRGIALSDRKIREGEWERPQGSLLKDKQVGIAGVGRIGSAVGRLCKAFGAQVTGYDPYYKDSEFPMVADISELAESSDILTLHLPFSSETKHIINSNILSRMKRNAILVNASRGGLIDEDALFNALSEGKISGTALDCFEEEPYSGKLKELDNVVLTGHIGSYAKEARFEMEKQALQAVLSHLNNGK